MRKHLAVAMAFGWLGSGAAQAVTITYSAVSEQLSTRALARGGPPTRTPVTDSQSDTASSTAYANSLDSTVLDQDPASGGSAIASSGSELLADLLASSTATVPHAIYISGITGGSVQVFGGGRAEVAETASISFLFEVDQATRFTLYMAVDYEDGNSEVNLYLPDGSLLIGLDLDPTLGSATNSGSVGLSGILNPGGQYRLEARASSGYTCIGSGTASCTEASAANFLFHLSTSPIPGGGGGVPEPGSAALVLGGLSACAVLAWRTARRAA